MQSLAKLIGNKNAFDSAFKQSRSMSAQPGTLGSKGDNDRV